MISNRLPQERVPIQCPACGKAEMVYDQRDITVEGSGRVVAVPKALGHHCPACSEVLLGLQEIHRVSALLRAAAGSG